MILEWQLWMHPYPTLIKTQRRRINPTLHPWGRVFQDGSEFVRVSDIFEARRRTSPQLKRCVRAIAKRAREEGMGTREALSKGFAICTRQLQRGGFLKAGTNRPTKKGDRAGRSKAHDRTHKEKVAEYERLLAVARGDV